MKARVERKVLADAAAWVGLAVHKGHVAALAGMKISATGNSVTLAAFNYDLAHTAHVSAEVFTDGECIVSGKFLVQMLGALTGNEVELVLDGNRLAVTAGRSTYRAAVMLLDDYPTLPALPKTVVAKVPAEILNDLVGIVEHAVTKTTVKLTETSMSWLYGIGLSGSEGELILMTTDRYRVARAAGIPDRVDDFNVTVPVAPLQAALKGLDGGLTVATAEGLIGLSDGNRSATMRLIDVPYGDLDRAIFSKKYTSTVETNTLDLMEAARRAVLLTEDKDLIELHIAPDEITVTVDASTADGNDTVECEADAELVACFNGTYLIQTLAAVGTSRVQLLFGDPTKQAAIEPVGDGSRSFALMPRRK